MQILYNSLCDSIGLISVIAPILKSNLLRLIFNSPVGFGAVDIILGYIYMSLLMKFPLFNPRDASLIQMVLIPLMSLTLYFHCMESYDTFIILWLSNHYHDMKCDFSQQTVPRRLRLPESILEIPQRKVLTIQEYSLRLSFHLFQDSGTTTTGSIVLTMKLIAAWNAEKQLQLGVTMIYPILLITL